MSEMKGIIAVLGEMSENTSEKETTEINLDECKNEGKGFKTLIPDEAYAKCRELMKVHEEIREIMAKNAFDTIDNVFKLLSGDELTYSMIEYVMFNDMLKETWDSITDLVAIHEFASKEEVSKVCKERGLTPERMLRTKMMNDLMGSIFK